MAISAGQVLLVNGCASLGVTATDAARVSGCHLTRIVGLRAARELIAKRQFDLILVDTSLPEQDGLDRFLSTDMTCQGRVVFVGNTHLPSDRQTSPDIAVERLPDAPSVEVLAQLFDHVLLRTPSREIPADGEFSGMIGRTMRMQALFENIGRVAPLDVGVLVHGESGTGKELVAQALHQLSGRRGKFVAVNCGAVSPELLGSQMFGHERGSFTGATQSHEGYFEQADGGTLFLDEITEMPQSLQVYLLRVIETHKLTRVGGSREIPVDVRIIAASNRDLQHAVAMGVLRQDLYFRLLEFPLAVPPLRERREDIPLLARHFLNQLNVRYGTAKCISDEVLRQFGLRSWPGNVRELRHAVQRQYILAGDTDDINVPLEAEPPLHRRATDPRWRVDGTSADPASLDGRGAIRCKIGMTLDDVERTTLLQTLAHCGNNKRDAARMLGVSLKTLYNKLQRYRAQGLIDDELFDVPPPKPDQAA